MSEKAILDNLDDVLKLKTSKIETLIAVANLSLKPEKQTQLKFPRPSEELIAAHKEVCAGFLETIGSVVGIIGKSRDL